MLFLNISPRRARRATKSTKNAEKMEKIDNRNSKIVNKKHAFTLFNSAFHTFFKIISIFPLFFDNIYPVRYAFIIDIIVELLVLWYKLREIKWQTTITYMFLCRKRTEISTSVTLRTSRGVWKSIIVVVFPQRRIDGPWNSFIGKAVSVSRMQQEGKNIWKRHGARDILRAA